jgi:DNA repair protein RadA/Sms
MAKIKALKAPRSTYRCDACGHVEAKWLGRCPACQEWNSLIEEVPSIGPTRGAAVSVADGAAPISLAAVGDGATAGGIPDAGRSHSGIGELDRVLGGGLVVGSMVLLGGDPGVGKSTLLLQALAGWADEPDGHRDLDARAGDNRAHVGSAASDLRGDPRDARGGDGRAHVGGDVRTHGDGRDGHDVRDARDARNGDGRAHVGGDARDAGR